MTRTTQISLTDCVYIPSYSLKCISCFRLRHVVDSGEKNPKGFLNDFWIF